MPQSLHGQMTHFFYFFHKMTMHAFFSFGRKETREGYRGVIVDILYDIDKTVLKLLQACIKEQRPTTGYLPSSLHHNKKCCSEKKAHRSNPMSKSDENSYSKYQKHLWDLIFHTMQCETLVNILYLPLQLCVFILPSTENPSTPRREKSHQN